MTEDVTLYAQWKGKATTIDFTKDFDNISSNYIITGEDIFTKYTTTSNGTKFDKYTDYASSDAQTEKVYYKLEFSDMQELQIGLPPIIHAKVWITIVINGVFRVLPNCIGLAKILI